MASESLTAQAVADLVGGRLLGEGQTPLRRVGSLEQAGPDALAFLASRRYLPEFRRSEAGCVLVPQDLAGEPLGPKTRIVVPDPHRALREALMALVPEPAAIPGVHPTATLGRGVMLAPEVVIGPHAVLGERVEVGARSRLGAGVVVGDGVSIGEDTVLDPNVVCYSGTVIGKRVWIKAGAVLGGTGFGFVPAEDVHLRIPHVGRCLIEDEVEIGSNTCVDRGSINDTIVGAGTKIDNMVHVAHNVQIGKRCLFMACVGIAGSVRIGDDSILAGQSGVIQHMTIGRGVRVASQAGVMRDLPDGATVSGSPARSHREMMRAQATIFRLADILRDLEALVQERPRGG